MNKKEFNYVSPTATIKEIQSEGVLCMSLSLLQQQSFGHEEWLEKSMSW